ncbi:ArdA Antirestriction protein [uncultured Caudovirales phage]|uniref:ArdA Antirestriction protein n=1 Tax=uncultured Caudovirales phage TaxID=2100421 RepID=A0A6J5NGT0_9CAUD|nr:ArdA Antirestriction protein [uncultured Caudovirales phage]
MTNRAFYYVDGIPTKGIWVDLDEITDTDGVLEALASAGLIGRDEHDQPVYGGDLLVACTEGELTRHFLSRHDTFDLAGYIEAAEDADALKADQEEVAAYISHFGSWSRRTFEEARSGEWDSERAFAENHVDELWDVPEHLQGYIDYDKVARDLFIDGYTFENGYVFRTDC